MKRKFKIMTHQIDQLKEEIQAKEYKEDHVLQLEEELKSLSHAKEQIAYLKAFRDMLSGYCIFKNKDITILQCSAFRKQQCKFDDCKTLKPWKDLFL